MKKLYFVFLFTIIFTLSDAADHTKNVSSSIDGVTVFLNQAQVNRTVRTNVTSGKTDLVIGGISSNINRQSIQVGGKGGMTIIGVRYQLNYLEESKIPLAVRNLRDTLHYYERLLEQIKNQKYILEKEEEMILSNKVMGGKQEILIADELAEMADFFRQRLTEISDMRMDNIRKIKNTGKKVSALRRQLRESEGYQSISTGEIVVTVSTQRTAAIELNVNYIVYNARWEPFYEVRATDTQSPLGLDFKARVYQNTGEMWDNVRLTLSTADPMQGNVKPDMQPWYLNFQRPPIMIRGKQSVQSSYRQTAKEQTIQASEYDADELLMNESAETTADYTSVIQTTVNTAYNIALPYTLLSSRNPQMVDIKQYSMDADYLYETVPKMDPAAFLIAKVTDWADYNLLPGASNVYFEGSYVGESFIDPGSTDDTLSISLGRDKSIVVERKKLKDFSTKKFIGANKTETIAYEISIRNTKNEPVDIKVEDQFPISQNSAIEAKLIEAKEAIVDKEKGKLRWDVSLKPSKTKRVQFIFEVKYPKNQRVGNL